MCLLAIFFRAVPDSPLIIGANREEFYDRPGEPPQILDGPIPAIGGRDPLAGGTWLGVNASGVVIAVTNRAGELPAKPRSRGLLVRDLLGCLTAKDAVELGIKELSAKRYAGCNLFCGDAERAVVLEGAEWLRIRPLPPGLHVLANRDTNDGSDPRVLYASDWLGQRAYEDAADCVARLQKLCGQTNGEHPPICLRGDKRGTVSSTVLAIREPLERSIFRHAQGPPDRTPYDDYSALIQELQARPC
ncbi:MAG TPA: NRDE family protein [Gemmataceae bacterium]|nr:NRDE family protein [Gemmataceae bacterium]